MSNLKKNSFVTFTNGRNKGYGIVASLNQAFYVTLVYHDGIKITTKPVSLNKCKEISQKEFIDLIDERGDTSWYSQADNIKTFYKVVFLGPIPKGTEYKEGEKVVLNGITFKYDEYYKRLEVERDVDDDDRIGAKVEVACPCCHGTKFTVGYGNYECIANCDCGHSMVVYDG